VNTIRIYLPKTTHWFGASFRIPHRKGAYVSRFPAPTRNGIPGSLSRLPLPARATALQGCFFACRKTASSTSPVLLRGCGGISFACGESRSASASLRLPNPDQARKLLNGGLPAGQEALKAATGRPRVAFDSFVGTQPAYLTTDHFAPGAGEYP